MRNKKTKCLPALLRKITGIALLVSLIISLSTSCNKLPFNDHFTEVVYIQTNNYMKSQNAIIAYRNVGNNKLVPVLGGPFFTGGSGVANPNQILGPNDSDGEIKISNDRRFLLAVNSGSNTIAVFKINIDGTLSPVDGSPFPSGGETPVSIDQWQQYIFVVNKSQNPEQPSTQKPNYTTFILQGNGSLTPVPNSTIELPAGSSPSQVLVSRTHSFVFGDDFLSFQLTPPQGTLRSFTVNNTGILMPVAGTPMSIPNGGGALGLWQNPTKDVLYVGFPTQAKLGIYDVNGTTGMLTYKSSVQANTAACWVRTNSVGDNVFVLNSGVNSVSCYNAFNPEMLTLLNELKLKNSGPTYMANGATVTSSECFSMGVSSNDKWLYVVSQHTNPDFSIGNFNYLHVLSIGVNGITEPGEPMQLPVPNTVRPRGVAVLRLN
jgi:6-phosphogluconolactonase (cycloisomerase 2 family)